jgi:inosose dehydratase
LGAMLKLGAAPISWGICEVPDWGEMLPASRVLSEMSALGFTATELGAPGFLPDEPAALRAALDEHGLTLIGAFVPLVLHDPSGQGSALESATRAADLLAGAGGEVFVTAAVIDEEWAPRRPLSDTEWDHLASMLRQIAGLTSDRGLRHVVHPHIGTVVQNADEIERLLELSDVALCLDTGHFTVGGFDPVDFVRRFGHRVGHVHLKDVDEAVAGQVRRDELSLMEAVQQGLFPPLGRGDVAIDEVVTHLEREGYQGWYVLEQDMAISGAPPAPGAGPMLSVAESLEYLRAIVNGHPAPR